MLAYLKARFKKELPLWHLKPWQFSLLVLWATWPWLCNWILPNNSFISLLPVIIFMPIAYLGGGLFVAMLPGWGPAYALGVSLTIFTLAYLGLVSWRQGKIRKALRQRRKKEKH
jgi:hypothetical protein